jgi:Soluble lytic murein transglycosylase and related regulatory proteins (some contain LysM/invasin domains)
LEDKVRALVWALASAFLAALLGLSSGRLMARAPAAQAIQADQTHALQAFPPAVRRWERLVRQAAASCNLDPVLVAALMTAESCGNPRAVSPKGAMGLLQVMPYHFAAGDDPFDPVDNLRVGVGVFCRLLGEANGDLPRALAAYNGGPQLLGLPPAAWPAESRLLIARVMRHLEDARAGRPIRCP